MIVDAFMFGDELELLELRLGQLDKITDRFIIIETAETFQRQVKPLYYQENKERFEKWNNKIVCISPKISGYCGWDREKKHREALAECIIKEGFPKDTTLSYSDCDEIPNTEVLAQYEPGMGLRNLKQYTFYYNFNHLFNYGSRAWSRARVGTVGDLYEVGADGFRGGPRDMDPTFPVIENGGWHCSWFGSSLNRVRSKVNAFSHDDMASIINVSTDAQIARDIVNGNDLFHREVEYSPGNKSILREAERWTADDSRLPSYFLTNKERFCMFTNEHFEQVHRSLLQ